MTAEDAIAALRAEADPAHALREAAYHKTKREVLGLRVPRITELATAWRQDLTTEARVALAQGLWDSGIHDARIAAAKLLVQARIAEDHLVWDFICRVAPECDGWAIADQLADAGARRLLADPSRIDTVAGWTGHENMWTRRATLVMTLPWAKMNNPKAQDLAIRAQVLSWATGFVADRNWFMQKAVAWWIRDLSRHDADAARAFLAAQGAGLKSFARKEAARHLPG